MKEESLYYEGGEERKKLTHWEDRGLKKKTWQTKKLIKQVEKREWDTWVSNFGIKFEINNMTKGSVWFGVESDPGNAIAMILKS